LFRFVSFRFSNSARPIAVLSKLPSLLLLSTNSARQDLRDELNASGFTSGETAAQSG